MIIPTQTPALKMVPIASQLFNVSARRRHNGINLLNEILVIIKVLFKLLLLHRYPFQYFLFPLPKNEVCFLFPFSLPLIDSYKTF